MSDVVRGGGSQIRGGGAEIPGIPPNLTTDRRPVEAVLVKRWTVIDMISAAVTYCPSRRRGLAAALVILNYVQRRRLTDVGVHVIAAMSFAVVVSRLARGRHQLHVVVIRWLAGRAAVHVH